MSESDAAVAKLTIREGNLLVLLDSAGVIMTRPDGSVRWGLNAEDVCELLELGFELISEWNAKTPAEVWTRAAVLLGVPEPAGLNG